jgi:quercetin dioxygenase-like cupin family protein
MGFRQVEWGKVERFDSNYPSDFAAVTLPHYKHLTESGTSFVYAVAGTWNVSSYGLNFELPRGYFAAVPNLLEAYTECAAHKLMVITRVGHFAPFLMGGPVESEGRLKYIDGCTDSLLIAPWKLGEPCLNHLHFPPGIDQTMHTHPSVRLGVVIRGRGKCITPTDETDLSPGMTWVIEPDQEHKFRTEDSVLDVLAYHPDSDFGPQDEFHPMLNRTIIDGISAADDERAQYRTA